MKNMPIPTCKEEGCMKRANFGQSGTKGTANRTHCASHGRALGLVDITVTAKALCEFEGCSKLTTFGYPGEKRSRCKAHKLSGQVDVAHDTQHCHSQDCTTRASFSKPGEKKPTFCKEHAPEGYKDVGGRRCKQEGCDKNACFGLADGSADFCKKHAEETMVNLVKYKTCEVEGCHVRPSHGEVGGHAVSCARHAKAGFVYLGSNLCSEEGCSTVAIYGPENTSKGIKCKLHGEPLGYVDVKNKRCAYEESGWRCQTQVYSNHLFCALHDADNVRRCRQAEYKLADWLKADFKIKYTSWNRQRTEKECGGVYRPDFVWELSTHIVILECDENQHKWTLCDFKRMVDLVNGYGGLPVVFIRYNPDSYKIGRRRRNPPVSARMQKLNEVLTSLITTAQRELLTICRLYFDSDKNREVEISIANWDSGKLVETEYVAFD